MPLRAMLRHHAATGSDVPVRLLYSARTIDDVIYRDELRRGLDGAIDIHFALTRPGPTAGRATPPHRPRDARGGRLAAGREPAVYICGPTAFVEAAADALVGLGHAPDRIKTERFGATGSR